jgi:formylglycine-generating enzyme required for sulfatase activity
MDPDGEALEKERNIGSPEHETWRDSLTPDDPFSMRLVRGGSFFAEDLQHALNPAIRLCDPPYMSYIDLGFRIAIYGPSVPRLDARK